MLILICSKNKLRKIIKKYQSVHRVITSFFSENPNHKTKKITANKTKDKFIQHG